VTITTETTSSSGGGGDTPVGPVRATIFEENFTSQDNSWGSSSANLAPLTGGTFNCDESDWTGILVGARRSCAAVGTKEVSGYAQTRSILLANNATSGSASVSFYAVTPTATTSRKVVTVHVFAIDADTGATNWHSSVEAPKLSSTSVTDITAQDGQSLSATVQNLPERFFLRFEPDSAINEKQFAIDAVKVTQVYNPNLTPLAAPVATAGEATMTSLAFSWGPVADATGYAVELRDGSGARVAYDAAVTGTATTFTDLNWNSDYTIRVKALGDDSTSCNSPWSAGVTGRTLQNLDAPAFTASADASAAVMAVVSNKTFSVSAERDGAPLAVSFGGLSPAASGTAPTFSSGTFSWTPSAGDEGKTFTATFTTDSGRYSTNIVFDVLARPPLAEPEIEITSAPTAEDFSASFAWDDQICADSYSVRLWHDTADYTKAGVCFENFFDFFDKRIPAGWGADGTGWYENYDNARIKFDKNATLTTRRFPEAVTTLSFHLRSSSTTATSSWTLFASTGSTNEAAWVSLTNSAARTGDVSLDFSKGAGYRRFKWQFTFVKSGGTLGLGNISFAYEGAGPKFQSGFGSVSEAVSVGTDRTLDVSSLKPNSEYFLEVIAIGDAGATTKSKVVRFATPPASPAMLMVFR